MKKRKKAPYRRSIVNKTDMTRAVRIARELDLDVIQIEIKNDGGLSLMFGNQPADKIEAMTEAQLKALV